MMDRIHEGVHLQEQKFIKRWRMMRHFTQTAWMIVAVVAFLSQLGSNAALVHVTAEAGSSAQSSARFSPCSGLRVGCFVISWAGKTFFQADVTFEEVVRTLGPGICLECDRISWHHRPWLRPGWRALPDRSLFWQALPDWLPGSSLPKKRLDLEWPQTIGTVVIGWVASLIVSLIAGAILGMFGLARRWNWSCFAGLTAIIITAISKQHSHRAVLFIFKQPVQVNIRI